MGFNFPAPAVPGQIYAAPGGPVYRYDAPIWTVIEEITTAPLELGLPGHVTPYMFGGVGDGVADDRLAIQLAIDYCFNTWRSGTVDMSGGRWLVDSANIQLRTGVYLVGSWWNAGNDEQIGGDLGGIGPNHFEQWKSSLIINPLYTIQYQNYDSCGVKGMVIIRKGLTSVPSSNPRAGVDAVKAFAGTAITVGTNPTPGGYSPRDTYFGYCFVVGFEYAYKAIGADRMHIEHIQGDCTNGIYIQNCYDMQHVSHCHFWPFVTSNAGSATYTVSGAANNGSGLIRLTTDATVLVTGDIVTVYNVGGVPNAAGRWTVTLVNSTTIDLQGSTFAGAFTSGGSVYLATYRRYGSAYWFDNDVDWGQMDHCFAFGWDIGFNLFSLDHGELLNCGADNNATTHDPQAIGFRVKDCHVVKMIGCKSAGMAIGVLVDCGANLTTTIAQHDCWGIQDTCIKVISGYAVISGSMLSGVNGIVVDPASDGVHVMGCRITGGIDPTKIVIITGDALRKSTLINNSWSENGPVGERWVNSYGNPISTRAYYHDGPGSASFVGQKARGSVNVPAAAQINDSGISFTAQFWDGVDTFRSSGGYRMQANANVTPTSAPSKHVWSMSAAGSVVPSDRLVMDETQLYSIPHKSMTLGIPTAFWSTVFTQTLSLRDSSDVGVITAAAGRAQIYIDPADGDLKIMFADGVTKTLATDT